MDGEFGFIDWVRRRSPDGPGVRVGPGDDCAVLEPTRRPLLVTTDMLMDGVDFVLAEVGGRRAGRKAMAANLSDIAAMAGRPTAAVVSVALPRDYLPSPGSAGEGLGVRVPSALLPLSASERGLGGEVEPPTSQSLDPSPTPSPRRGGEPDPEPPSPLTPLPQSRERGTRQLAEDLFLGLQEAAAAFGVPIVGGDTNAWAGPLAVSVTALGEATGRGPVLRDGATPGDWLFVTGPLGGSILGRHLDFTPRVREAQALHAAVELRAMIDVSDGLAADLNHILDESGCGAVLFADAVPVSEAAVERGRQTGRPPLAHALGDGEDFELVFAVSPDDGEKLLANPPVPVWKVGECVEAGLWIEDRAGRRPLEPTGWAHAFGS